MNIDIIMFIIRKLALKLPDLKVVLMSATLQEDLFVNYFQQVFGPEQVCEPYFVGVKRFPVDVHFIDEIDALRMERYWCEEQSTAANHLETLVDELSQDPEVLKFHPVITAFAKKICTNLIISQSKLGEGILVFLPSFSDLSDYHNELTNILRRKRLNDRISVFVFHGLVPNEEQDDIFKLPPNGRVHVILSNKAAESSITIPNLRMVINFGINQNLEYNSQRKMSCLKKRWCSRSSCFQREGRVGRVFKGIAVHLFTREFYDTSLPEFDVAEITKYPLAKTVLKAKQLGRELNIPLPSQFLSLVIEPPSLLNFEAALQDLVKFGAVVYNPDKGVCEDTDITLVGKFCLSLPLDLKLGRLVLFGIFFGCPFDAITMAAALSMYQDVFTLPTRMVIKDVHTYHNSLKRSMDARLNFDNGYCSHPIMMCNMFVEWLRFRSNSKWYISRGALARQFAYKYSVRADRLLHFESLVGEIALHVCQFIPSTAPFYKQMQRLSHVVKCGAGMPHFEQPGTSFAHLSFKIPFCDDSVFLKALIAAASPNLIIRGKPEHESSVPDLRKRARVTMNMVKDVQFDPFSTIAMEIEDAEADEDEIDEDKSDEDEIDEDKIDEAILQKLVNEIFPSQTNFKVKIFDNIALIQFNQSSSMRLFWQFSEVRDNWQIEGINATFPMPFHPHCLTWNRLTVNRERANVHYFNWRNPAGFVCREQYPNHPTFAVASEILGTNDPHYGLASHITVLPQMPQGLLLLLAFQPISTNIELLVEKNDSRISAVRINSQEIEHTAAYINTADICRINKLRKALSEAMICFLNGATIPIDHPVIVNIPTLLQDVLNRTDSDLSNPPMYATTSGKAPQPHHPATVWETISPGVDFSAVSQTAVNNKYSHFYPSFQCSLAGGQPYSVREEVLSQGRGKSSLHIPSVSISNVQYHSPPSLHVRELQASSSIYVKVRAPCDTSSMILPRQVLSPFLQSSLQPGLDQRIAKFFIKYLKENGGEVSITILSQVFYQTYFKEFQNNRKQTKTPSVKLKQFFTKHPNFQVVKESNTGTRVVKLQKATMNSLKHQSPQPGSEQHMVEFCVQNLKQSGGKAPLISLWRKYHREYRYNHRKHERILRKLLRGYPQHFILIKSSTLQKEMVKLSGFVTKSKFFSHLADQSRKPRSYRAPTYSVDLVPIPNSEQSHKHNPYHSPKSTSDLSHRLNWFPKPSSQEYLLDIFHDFAEDNDGETPQCIFQSYCKYFKKHQKQTGYSKPKIKFKKFFKTYFQVTSCVGASMKTVMLRKPTMRLEQDIVPTWLTPKPRKTLFETHQEHLKRLSIGLYLVKLQKPIDVMPPIAIVESCGTSKVLNTPKVALISNPNATTFQPGSSHHMVEFFINYLERNGEKSILFLQNMFERHCFQQLKQTRKSERILHKFFKTYPQHFKVFRNSVTGLCMVKLWKPIVRIQLRLEEEPSTHDHVSTVKACDNKSTVKTSELHHISSITSPSLNTHQSCQPGSDQHILNFFIDYLEHSGREVSTSILSETFCRGYLNKYKDHWRQTGRPEIKLKVFFKTHPQHFQVVKNSTTGTRVVKLVRQSSLAYQCSTTMLDPVVEEFKHSHTELTASAEMSSDVLPVVSSTFPLCVREGTNLQPSGALLKTARSIPSLSSEPGSDQHMVQYFVDCLKKRGGEASITSLRKAFATYVEMLPDGISCPYSSLGKSFFESHPKHFKLVQGCGFCTVKLSLTSADNESHASGNAVDSIQALSDPEPVAKQSHVSKTCTPAVVETTSVLMPSSSTSDPGNKIDVNLPPTFSSVVCHVQSRPEGDSRNSISTVSSTIQPCSYVLEASQGSKLQPYCPLLAKTLSSVSYECCKHLKLVQGCGFCSVKLCLAATHSESLTSGNAVNSIQAVSDPETTSKQSHVAKTCTPEVVEATSVQMPSSSTSDPGNKVNDKLQPSSTETSQDSKLQPSGSLLTKALTSIPYECSKPASDQRMVQYFVDSLKKRGGEASITSLRRAFATYVEMLPDAILCPPYLCKSFFESHPKHFKLVQGCGFCTVKMSTDDESLTSGNAVNSIQAVSHPEPVVKQSHVTKIPEVSEATSVLMPSSSTSDPNHTIYATLQPTSSSITCQPGSEGDSRNSVSSTLQPCSYVPEASQDSKLQPSGPLLTKTLTSLPYECSKPGSDQHMLQYFVDCLKKRGGEASITSLRKAFATYVEMLPDATLCPPYLCKSFFKSRPKHFKLVQGCGFCTVKMSTDDESLTSGNAVNSIQAVSHPEPVAKQSHVTKIPAVVEATSALMPSSSTSDPDHRSDIKLQPTSSSILCQPGSERDSRNLSSTIQPCSYVPEASQDSKLQSSGTTSIPYECPKPGSDQHMVEFFVDYLKAQSGGKASITSLIWKVYSIYLTRFSNDVKKHYISKKFFKSHPQYFELIEGDGFCTVKLCMLPPDAFRSDTRDREDIAKTAQSQCASTTTDPKPRVKRKSRGYPASAIAIKKSCSHSAKAELSVCEQKGRLPIVEVPPGEKTTLDAVKPVPSMNVESRNVKVLPSSNSIQCQYSASAVRPVPSSARQDT